MTQTRNAAAEKRNAAMDALRGPPPTADAPAPLASVPAVGSEASASPAETPVVAATPAKPSRDVAKVMLYLPPRVARKFKEIAFHEERKAHDVYLEALDLYLTQQGYGGLKGVSER